MVSAYQRKTLLVYMIPPALAPRSHSALRLRLYTHEADAENPPPTMPLFRPCSSAGVALAGTVLAGIGALAAGSETGWVAETPHFRVVVQGDPGLEAAAAKAAGELEALREEYLELGLGVPRRTDGPLDVLIVSSRLDLHGLMGLSAPSRVRGLTIRGTDRDLAVIPWYGSPPPATILAHEYAHQLEDDQWPEWFTEGRAVYLARLVRPANRSAPHAALTELLQGAAWSPWRELTDEMAGPDLTGSEHFQAQSWLLVHWLATQEGAVTRLTPKDAAEVLARLGEDGLSGALSAHLDGLGSAGPSTRASLSPTRDWPRVREAARWEVPLLQAETLRDLRRLEVAGPLLESLADRFPEVARVQAAKAALHLLQGDPDQAERHYGRALELGDPRARTAYRFAVLLMRPGPLPLARAETALRFALRASQDMPEEPSHVLAVAHAHMLAKDWNEAYRALRHLARFPGWAKRAAREGEEIQRRIGTALRAEGPPLLSPGTLPGPVDVPVPTSLPAWQQDQQPAPKQAGRRRWPPYGTWLTHGRVAWVDCSGATKKIVLHSPYRRYVFRENPGRPPRFINRPFRGSGFPCDSRGWVVAIAYRRDSTVPGTDGEMVGARF